MIKLIPILLTIIAGISTLLGYFIILINKKYQEMIINFSLSFSAGILLSISLFHLSKEAFLLLDNNIVIKISIMILLFIAGIFLSNKIRKLKRLKNNNQLYRIGLLSTLIMIIHNIPEGMITYITSKNNLILGLKITLAIALHNIPEGITISVPIYYSTNSKKKAFIATLLSAFSETAGAIICALVLEKYITNSILAIIFILTAALMTDISIKELLKEALNYSNNNITIMSFLMGFLLLLLISFL